MKRQLLIGTLVLPFAFLAGRMGGATAEESNPGPVKQAAPAKSAGRSADTRRNPGKGRSPAWSILRKRAAQTPDELIDELLASGGGPRGDSWIIDHLLATDPERLFREMYRRREGSCLQAVIRRWSLRDPERALPLLLGNEEPFAWRGQEFYDPHPPVVFNRMGMVDPEKGLAMIDALPPGQREAEHYATLLEGIAGTAPEKLSGYFEKITAKGKIPDQDLVRMLDTYAAADPQAALAWAKGQGDPIPEKLIGSLLKGLAKGDVTLAARLYDEAAVKPAGEAAYWIGLQMARGNPDLDATWAWIERNSDPANREARKSEALGMWARRNPEAAVERVLAHPELLVGRSSYEIAGMVVSSGKMDDLLARAEQMPPEQANAIKRTLARVGGPAIPPPPGSKSYLHESLALMRKDPEKGEENWRSMDGAQRQKIIDQLANSSGEFHDPALVMKLLVEAKADLGGEGARSGLARLSIMDPEAAARIAEQAPAGKSRSSIVEAIYKNWSVDDLTAATAWREKMSAGQ